MKFNNALLGAALMLFAGLVLHHVRGFNVVAGQLNPALFPTLISYVLIGCGLALVASGVRHRRTEAWIKIAPWLRSPRLVLNAVVVVGVVAFYVAFSGTLGFLITTPLGLFALLFCLGTRWYWALLIAVLVTLLIHYIFYTVLHVDLPWGVLTPYAW